MVANRVAVQDEDEDDDDEVGKSAGGPFVSGPFSILGPFSIFGPFSEVDDVDACQVKGAMSSD